MSPFSSVKQLLSIMTMTEVLTMQLVNVKKSYYLIEFHLLTAAEMASFVAHTRQININCISTGTGSR